VPDPSERLWRHPSEIAAERAAAEAAAGSSSADSPEPSTELVGVASGAVARTEPGGGSILWPIAVVGGSIAIAAFGVLGLSALGPSGSNGLRVGGPAMSTADGALSAAVPPVNGSPSTTLEAFGLSAGLGSDEAEQTVETDPWGMVSTTVQVAAPPEQPAATTTTSLLFQLDRQDDRAEPEFWTSTSVPGGSGWLPWASESFEPQPGDDRPAAEHAELSGAGDTLSGLDSVLSRFAIYETDSLDRPPLASLLAIGEHLLSSAGAIGDRDSFFIRVGEEFHPATVTGRDWYRDVAVVEILDDAGFEFPTADVGTQPVAEFMVTIGYCGPERTETGQENGEENRQEDREENAVEPDVSSSRPLWCDPSSDAVVGPQPDQLEPSAPSASNQTGGVVDGGATPQPNDPSAGDDEPSGSAPEAAEPGGPEAERSDQADSTATEAETKARTGAAETGATLWGLAFTQQPSYESAPEEMAYLAIKTHIRRTTEMSGAPLRDELGRIVGMVTSGTGQYVSAVPIEQVVNAAEALLGTGEAGSVWIGIEVTPVADGLLIQSIDSASPFAGLLTVGDVLVGANGEPLLDREQLLTVLRRIGVGQSFVADYIGRNGPADAQVAIVGPPTE
jgi:hypothetical protein